jgi:PPOX class probable F420-dependent enzyme
MAPVLTGNLLALLETTDVGVLGVTRKDGSVHQSLVYHLVRDGKIYVSTEPQRVKGRAVARDGRASYAVRGSERPYPSFTVEGPAELQQGDGIGEITSALFAKIFGQPLDEPFDDETVRNMNRAVIEITPERVYGVSHLEA